MILPFPVRHRAVTLPFTLLGVSLLGGGLLRAEPQKLAAGDLVAICGDSITEQRIYSVDMEEYLLACQPAARVRASEFGWGGETAQGFLPRMENDVLGGKPNVATLCYGMNDGGYIATDAKKLATYRENLEAVVKKFKAAGVRDVVVGTPGAVDTTTFKSFWGTPPDVYNQTLADFGATAKQVAVQERVGFADLHTLMLDVMGKMKAKYGKDYVLAGHDGIHPNENGHLVMAYAFLKALGCTGDVGTLTLDASTGLGSASEGHKILQASNNKLEVESTRYPFCFYGADAAKPESTRGVLEFLPFNQELNRFMLVVKNAPTERMKVTFGKESKEFAKADLEKGVNLAAEFLDNPFSEPFKTLQEAVGKQQHFELLMMKDMLHNVPDWKKAAVGGKAESFDALQTGLWQADAALREETAAVVVPVRYEVRVEPVAAQ